MVFLPEIISAAADMGAVLTNIFTMGMFPVFYIFNFQASAPGS